MAELRVTSIKIRDVLGAEEFALEPGRITRLEGRNGSGKTSVLQAVQAALGRGSLVKLARVAPDGAPTEPEVVLALEGDGEAFRVERTGDRVRVRRRVGDTAGLEDVPRPQEFLEGLFDAAAASPVRFLTAPKERVLLLLEALPVEFDRGALLADMGLGASELPEIPAGLHPFEELTLIRDSVFRTRTGVNRDAKGKAAAAEQTRRNAPAVLPEDLTREVEQLDGEVATLGAEVAREQAAADSEERAAVAGAEATARLEEQRVAGEFKAYAAKARREHEARAAEIRAEAEKRVAAELAQVEASIETRRVADEELLERADETRRAAVFDAREAGAAVRAAVQQKQARLASSRERLATLRAQAEAAAKTRALHDQATQFDREAEELARDGERLSGALDHLDEYRRRLAADLPIPGLSIEDKGIRVNGIPFDQLNTAERVRIAVQVSTLRTRKQRLPLLFVDGAEALDREHFDALVAELKALGVQAFVARVSDEDLRVVAA